MGVQPTPKLIASRAISVSPSRDMKMATYRWNPLAAALMRMESRKRPISSGRWQSRWTPLRGRSSGIPTAAAGRIRRYGLAPVGAGRIYTPDRSNAGVYSSLAEVRSWVYPSQIPQFSI